MFNRIRKSSIETPYEKKKELPNAFIKQTLSQGERGKKSESDLEATKKITDEKKDMYLDALEKKMIVSRFLLPCLMSRLILNHDEQRTLLEFVGAE
ncbi:hypothetical protein TNCT_523061 [Trichonephila clavata]|uniref:Uncharacterized protein n=1 Tax=Trichonephila clavata TaxID=2740835 RepID=A0A8X6M2G1_TRICU|nr:hypothetical protein TNCT_523061 [Trichonephila clavata]